MHSVSRKWQYMHEDKCLVLFLIRGEVQFRAGDKALVMGPLTLTQKHETKGATSTL